RGAGLFHRSQAIAGLVEARTSTLHAIHHAVVLARRAFAFVVEAPSALMSRKFGGRTRHLAEIHPLGPLAHVFEAQDIAFFLFNGGYLDANRWGHHERLHDF